LGNSITKLYIKRVQSTKVNNLIILFLLFQYLHKKMISRSKVEHIVCLALNGINIIFYLLVIIAVIFKCIGGKFSDIVMGIYGM
jgi:hypothetical protein